MSRVVSGGGTNRQHLQVKAKHSEIARKQLEDPEIPPGCAHVWIWFSELNEVRGGAAGTSGWIPSPISFFEIESWARLTERQLSPSEIAMLRSIDRVWLAPEDEAEAGL
jgi:hypothetical protein